MYLINVAVLEDATDNSFPGNLVNVAVETTIVAVIALAIDLINNAVDVAVADSVFNMLASVEMVLVLVDVADNVGVRVIVSSALIATLFTLDPFIAIFN